MHDWHPKHGDYVKHNAMEDSRKKKQKERINKGIIYTILIAAVVTVLILLFLVV